jgi:hypothetical protein
MKEFHWFWAWDDEKEEAWLGEMARKGWHFQSVMLPGFYTFELGEPREDVYRLDFLTDYRAKADYLQLFMDAGWEYMGEMGSWQYFRKTAREGEVPEIFSDNASKATKYRRVLLVLVILLPLFVNSLNLLNKHPGTFNQILTFVMFLFMILYAYGIVRLGMRVKQLQKKI